MQLCQWKGGGEKFACIHCGFTQHRSAIPVLPYNRQCTKPLPPCTHIGDTLRTVDCPTCSGRVKVKVFACSVHGECTLGKSVDGVACCLGCKDHSELT